MPLVCAGTQLLRKSSVKSDREVCEAFVQSVDGAIRARNDVAGEGEGQIVPLRQVPSAVMRGNDMSLLFVLQRELGAVAPSEYNPISKSCLQSRICSIDATTCLIVGMRDPYSGTTTLAHFDDGSDEQVDSGVAAMLNHLPPKPVVAQGVFKTQADREAVDELQEKFKAKRVVQLYMLGAVKYPRFSAENLSGVLRHLADDADTVYDIVLGGTCVWGQNLADGGKMLVHRGLMIDSKSGAATPVSCDKQRAYPAGRLRGLRCFSDDKRLSSVTLMPGETVTAAAPVDEAGRRKALQYVVIVRPFNYPAFNIIVARKSLTAFAAMSTSPEMEPEDFAETLKSSVVFASLTSASKVFTPNPKTPTVPAPVAMQLAISDVSATTGAGATAAAEEGGADADAAAAAGTPATEDGSSKVEEVADDAARELAFEWVQISPVVAPAAGVTAPAQPAAASA